MKTATNSDPDKTPVAKDVMTLCTKEKIETWHVVMAHNAAGIVDRVKCKACGAEHKYKRQNALLKTASKSSSSSLLRKIGQTQLSSATRSIPNANDTKNLEEVWLYGLKKWGSNDVGEFSPNNTYKAGDVFNHSVFGKGVVQARRENKVDVLFNVGMKTLPSKVQAN